MPILPKPQSMIIEFWQDLKREGLATNRTLDSLFRLAKAQARLHLSNVVTEEIATEMIEDYRLRMLQYGKIIKSTESPREVTYREMLSIIKTTKSPITLTEAARMASKNNEQTRIYLGTRLDIKHSWGLQSVRDMLLEHPSIKLVKERPIVLLWSEEDKSKDSVLSSPSQVTDVLSDVRDVRDDGNGDGDGNGDARLIPDFRHETVNTRSHT